MNDQFGINSGAAFVFERVEGGNTFTQLATLYSPSPAVSALFGWSVAVNAVGDIAIGARGDRIAQGSVYVYQKAGANSQWNLIDTLAPDVTSDPPNVGNFGWSLAFDTNFLVVGAPNEGVGANKIGAIFLYEKTAAGTLRFVDTKYPADGNAGDLFGFSVDIDESTLVVGSRNHTHHSLAVSLV